MNRSIEKCCSDVFEYTASFAKSISVISQDLHQISKAFDQSEEAPRFSAHVEYTQNEYLKFVQAKIVRFLQLIFISRIWKQERFS